MDNPPAFPQPIHKHNFDTVPRDFVETGCGGMTLRDYFAAAVASGDWAAQGADTGEFVNSTPDEFLTKRAETYYRMADAMLKARNKGQ